MRKPHAFEIDVPLAGHLGISVTARVVFWKRGCLAVAVVLLSLPYQISEMDVFDLYKIRPATLPCHVGNTS